MKKANFRNLHLGILLLFIAVFLSNCKSGTSSNNSSDTSITDSSNIMIDSSIVDEKLVENWTYSEEEDKLTGQKKYFASINANELLQFDFPYDGGVTASLLIRKKDGSNDIILQISNGQFKTKYDGTSIKARFDKDKAKSWSVSEASDASSNVLFINNAGSFIKQLKKHNSLIIQAEFFQEGQRQMEFNIKDFKWAH